jgi:hypothetical protein
MIDWIDQIKAFQEINRKSKAYGMDVINVNKNNIKQENIYIMATKENNPEFSIAARRDH